MISLKFTTGTMISDGSMKKAAEAREILLNRKGPGAEFTGWLDVPAETDAEEIRRIKKAAAGIRADSQVLVVIGIGGSYLGAKAAIDMLKHRSAGAPEVIFAGTGLSADACLELMGRIGQRDFSINVISKSGTTLEPAIAFRIFRKLLIEKYGPEAANRRIYATTDASRGALREMADRNGWQCFTVPEDVGGRYSVLTSVGLLPIAAAGLDIDSLLSGAAAMREELLQNENSIALEYAAARRDAFLAGREVELFAGFDPDLHMTAEWWRQLFGESEGKEGKGIFPDSVNFTRDLHSIGQFIQQGTPILMETVLDVVKSAGDIVMEPEEDDTDGLNYLAGKTLNEINRTAMESTIQAHREAGVPVNVISICEKNEKCLGELFYFFEFACAVSGYMNGVNPFDQPGVEVYKRNMFRILGKAGY